MTPPQKNNLNILAFNKMFEKISIQYLNTLFSYNILQKNIKFKKDFYTILKSIILDHIHEEFAKNEKCDVLYINKNFMNQDLEIFEFFDRIIVTKKIIGFCMKISKNLPLPIFVDKDTDFDITVKINEDADMNNILEDFIAEFKNKTLSLKKIKKLSNEINIYEFMKKYYSQKDINNNIMCNKYIKGVH